jgi:hypothetical protein
VLSPTLVKNALLLLLRLEFAHAAASGQRRGRRAVGIRAHGGAQVTRAQESSNVELGINQGIKGCAIDYEPLVPNVSAHLVLGIHLAANGTSLGPDIAELRRSRADQQLTNGALRLLFAEGCSSGQPVAGAADSARCDYAQRERGASQGRCSLFGRHGGRDVGDPALVPFDCYQQEEEHQDQKST